MTDEDNLAQVALGKKRTNAGREGIQARRRVAKSCLPVSGKIDGEDVMRRGKVCSQPGHVSAMTAPAVHQDERSAAKSTGLIKCQHR